MNIDHHVLWLFADVYLPVGDGLVPTGEICAVAGTPMDFSQPRPVDGEESIDYDHCWFVNPQPSGDDLMLAARLSDHVSGRVMEISTNQPRIQFCDGEYLDGSAIGHTDTPCGPLAGLFLEPQNFPNMSNNLKFSRRRLEPGEVYTNRAVYNLVAE